MLCFRTFSQKIYNYNKIFNNTIIIYRKALSFIMKVITKEIPYNNGNYVLPKNINSIEYLIHGTKSNIPKYMEFDKLFYKFPSYFRRSAIQDALGCIQSYYSQLDNYYLKLKNQPKCKDKIPKLNKMPNKFPVFYKGNMYNKIDNNKIQLKIYYKNDWCYLDLSIKGLTNNQLKELVNFKECNPSLIKKGKKYYISIPFSTKISIIKKKELPKIQDQKILSVDLGINISAVCCLFKNRTVLGRKFINQSREKDYLLHKLNKLKKVQRISGKCKTPNFWRKINNIQNEIVNNTVNEIIKYAKQNKVNVIILEYLKNGFKGNKTQKLHHWRKMQVQNKLKNRCLIEGIYVSYINPCNTSKLAFDGSGQVIRDKHNYSLCTFSNGKQYNCDLNACYNIYSRYMIREIINPLTVKERLLLEAKVPEVVKRTSCTMATIIKTLEVINNIINY